MIKRVSPKEDRSHRCGANLLNNRKLREGLTTGSTATAAAMAAFELAATGHLPEKVQVPLPPFRADVKEGKQAAGWREMPVLPAPCGYGRFAAASIKDGGDDPDATNGALVVATIESMVGREAAQELVAGFLEVDGGHGVGRVTLPGLAVKPGEAAINPVPREQLFFAIFSQFGRFGTGCRTNGFLPPYRVVISVPDGEKIAMSTMNERLGIVGGISILGTHGTVKPFSSAAWSGTIKSGLMVARAAGEDTICFSTGRRSEKLLMASMPWLPPQCFIQAGDMAAFSLASARGFKNIVWGCFFGKLVKLAQGLPNTHAHAGELDMEFLQKICLGAGMENACCIGRCRTAQGALELMLADNRGTAAIGEVMRLAKKTVEKFASGPVRLLLFHLDGRMLSCQ